MPPAYHETLPTFAGGEITPAMYSRVDMAKYKTALKTARNGIIHPQGGFSGRTGFRFVAAAKFSNRKCRLIRFKFSFLQSYMIEVGHLYMRFYVNGAQITSGGNPVEIATPYQESELPALNWTQSANTIYFAHQNHPPQTLVRISDTSWTLSAFPFINGPFNLENADITKSLTLSVANGAGTLSGAIVFDSSVVGGWWQIVATVNSQSATNTLTDGTKSDVIRALNQWKLATTGTWNGLVNVQYAYSSTTPDGLWQTLATFSSANNNNFNTFGAIPIDKPVYIRVTAALVGGSGPVNIVLTADAYTYTFNVKVTGFNSFSNVNVQQVAIPGSWPTDTVTSSEWSRGAWSADQGFPAVVGFYQDRLCWGTTVGNPIGFWMSQSGNYVDYGVSDPLVDSDAISLNLPAREFTGINNLVPMFNLLIMTASNEFGLAPGNSGDLSPTSIDCRVQGYRGCSTVRAITVGNQAIYVQPQGTVLRNINFQVFYNIFTGDNISLMAEHLFRNYTILDMTYCQEPDSIVYLVRSDGQLIALTYLPEQQVLGYTHFDTAGSFLSCATIPTSNYDELWVVVQRSFGIFIERQAQYLPTDETEDQFHVDCGIDYIGAPTTSISGLAYLNGQSVIVLADGNVQGPYTVVGGSITLGVAASVAHIGLPYTVDMETLNVEVPNQDGTSQGRRQRVAGCTIRFNQSLGGFIGPDANHLHPMNYSKKPSLDSAAPLFSDDYKVPLMSSWQVNGRMFIRQTDPLPLNITGLFPVVESGNL